MCRECLNVVQFTSLVTETRQHIIDRSPNAFAPKVALLTLPDKFLTPPSAADITENGIILSCEPAVLSAIGLPSTGVCRGRPQEGVSLQEVALPQKVL